MLIEPEPFLARLQRVVGDRRVYPWATKFGLSRATIGRLLQGDLPAPERFVLMIRQEGLSLSWLFTGQGAPYLFQSPFNDATGADLLRHIHSEMLMPDVVVLRNRDSLEGKANVAVVLSETVPWKNEKDEESSYCNSEVIGGPNCGPLTGAAALSLTGVSPRRVICNAPEFRRLVSGNMSLPEFWDLLEVLPVDRRKDYETISEIERPSEGDKWNQLSELEQRVIMAMRNQNKSARLAIVGMAESMQAFKLPDPT